MVGRRGGGEEKEGEGGMIVDVLVGKQFRDLRGEEGDRRKRGGGEEGWLEKRKKERMGGGICESRAGCVVLSGYIG